jgi:hypothetical protein
MVTWRAHWKKMALAFKYSTPILGILKDYKTGWCASQHLFDCVGRRFYKNGNGFYLQLQPKNEVGCAVRRMEIDRLSGEMALDDVDDGLRRRVAVAEMRSPQDRLDRIKQARKFPERIIVKTTAFLRNEDVIAEVLSRAEGHCELCKKSAPFKRRRDLSPYLEVHHKVRLADGGEDTLANAIATCPNCHRSAHYG